MAPDNEIHRASAAGRFYPGDAEELKRVVKELLASSEVAPASNSVVCIIAPHAGYMYSGKTAACAFARVPEGSVRRVILLGCSHHYRYEGASIPTGGIFETPIARFHVDSDLAEALINEVGTRNTEPHEGEHSLEVHLPFIAVRFGTVPIVPVLFGSDYSPWHADFAHILSEHIGEGDLVVASTDLSHFLSEAQADKQDHQSLDILLHQDVRDVVQASEDGRFSMCGVAAVATAMCYSAERDATSWNLLDYRTSAEASGDTSRVVGYAAVSMEMSA